jgi:hypothetical protein
MEFKRAGGGAVYIILGILAGLILLTLISFYLFGSWKDRAHTNKPQSSEMLVPAVARMG